MTELRKTPLHARHVALGAKMVDFGSWDMPLQYAGGIVAEHLATRKTAGLFDVSHMGRFIFRGAGALALLLRALTNNAAALEPGQSQYTIIQNEAGQAIDDAYLYHFDEDEYLLVVNAANRQKDWAYFQSLQPGSAEVDIAEASDEIAMISLQGPLAEEILSSVIDAAHLPKPGRNHLSRACMEGIDVDVARTGYTGEPLCFELFVKNCDAPAIWDILASRGGVPVGLGARDTLRLEASLPLYGHELGTDPEGNEMPIFACPLSRFAVSFAEAKGNFIGKDALVRQHDALGKIQARDYSSLADLPRIVKPLAVLEKAIARQGSKVFDQHGEPIGYVTSGTMVPYWKTPSHGAKTGPSSAHEMRPICLAILDSNIADRTIVQVEVRGKNVNAMTVPYNLRGKTPPYAQAVIYEKENQSTS